MKRTIKVSSTAFAEGEMIPKKYTADGPDVSPPLAFDGIPEAAKSISLICDDPDAPAGTWVHWVLFNLPPDTRSLPEGIAPQKEREDKSRHGANDFGKIGYGGPAPPRGVHRYYFKVYALDRVLDLTPGATKAQLVRAMQGHILAEGQLMGRYTRQ